MSNYSVFYGQEEHNKKIGEFKTKKEAMKFITSRLKDGHYIRTWYMPEYSAWTIDFGSHINFYFMSDFDYKEGDTL